MWRVPKCSRRRGDKVPVMSAERKLTPTSFSENNDSLCRPADAPQQLASLQEQGRNGGKGGGCRRRLRERSPLRAQSNQESAGEPGTGMQICPNANRTEQCECAPPGLCLQAQAPSIIVWAPLTAWEQPPAAQQRYHLKLTSSRGQGKIPESVQPAPTAASRCARPRRAPSGK